MKEALGITWARERFADYVIGLKFHIGPQATSTPCGELYPCEKTDSPIGSTRSGREIRVPERFRE